MPINLLVHKKLKTYKLRTKVFVAKYLGVGGGVDGFYWLPAV